MILIMEQPKDYLEEDEDDLPEIPTFEEFLESEYQDLTIVQKFMYHLQDYIFLALFTAFLGGYLTGIRFGVFW